jgi:predicted nucleotidyltransferase
VASTAPTPDSLRTSLLPLWETGEFQLIVLFGSWARGRGGPGSDLDLAFLPKDGMNELHATSEVIRLTHRNDVDVVNLRHADPIVAMEVARSGVVLFARDASDFTEFRSLAFRRYVDSEKLRRGQTRALDRFEQRHEPT